MGDWFKENAPTKKAAKPAESSGDWFKENAPTAAAPQQQKGEEPGLLSTAADVVKGAAKGAAHTVVGLAEIGENLLTFGQGKRIRDAVGAPATPYDPENEAATKAALEPTNTAQKVGYGVEQAAEFLIPGGVVTKGAKAVKAATTGVRGAKALNIGARAGMEAASGAAVAGVQTGGDAEAMRDAALMSGGLSAAAGVVAAGAQPMAQALKSSALKQYSQVLNATTKGNKFLSSQVVPELIDRGVVAGTMKGLKGKASDKVAELGQAIGDEFANLPAGTAVELRPILQRMAKAVEDDLLITGRGGKQVAKGPHAATGKRNVEGLARTLTDLAERNPTTGVWEVPVERVRTLRQYFDEVAAKGGRYEGKALADQASAEAHGMAADAIRQELAQAFPSIAKLNKEFHFWKNVDKVVGDTVMRRQGQAKPLGRKLAGAAGAASGYATGGIAGLALGKTAMDTFEALVTSPAWGTVAAVTKDRIAKALASGNRSTAEFYIRKAAKAAATNAAASHPAESQSLELAPVQ